MPQHNSGFYGAGGGPDRVSGLARSPGYFSAGRHEWILFDMLERLEGRQEPAAEPASVREAVENRRTSLRKIAHERG